MRCVSNCQIFRIHETFQPIFKLKQILFQFWWFNFIIINEYWIDAVTVICCLINDIIKAQTRHLLHSHVETISRKCILRCEIDFLSKSRYINFIYFVTPSIAPRAHFYRNLQLQILRLKFSHYFTIVCSCHAILWKLLRPQLKWAPATNHVESNCSERYMAFRENEDENWWNSQPMRFMRKTKLTENLKPKIFTLKIFALSISFTRSPNRYIITVSRFGMSSNLAVIANTIPYHSFEDAECLS